MKRLPWVGRIVLVAIAALLYSLLTAMPQASATGSWPQDVRGNGDLIASPDGDVLNGECYTGWSSPTLPPSSTAFDGDGDQQFQLAPAANATVTYRFCGAETAVNTDGTFYGVKTTAVSSTYRQHAIVAYKDGDLVWEYSIPEMCTGKETAPDQIVIGSDGDVYVVVEASCEGPYSSDKTFALTGLVKATGSAKFTQNVGASDGRYKTVHSGTPVLMPYGGGLITEVGSYYYRTFRYFSTSGTEDTGKRRDVSASYAMDAWTANDDGTLFVATQTSSYSCSPSLITNMVTSYPISGSSATYNLTTECLHSTFVKSTPDGGAVLMRDQALGAQQLTHPVLKLWPSSNTFSYFIVPEVDVSQYGSPEVAVDISGNVLLGRSLNRQSGDYDRIVELTLFGESGRIRAQYRSPYRNDNSQQDQSSLYSPTGYGLALAKGAVYFAAVNNRGSQFTVEKLALSEADAKYPEMQVAGVAPSAPSEQKYVASGDSFSAGEGVEPFLEGTATSGSDECHRSENAYSELLNRDTALALTLVAFPACSGATTSNIVASGQWGESKQLDAIPTDADVVTLTIGGNDVGFAKFVTQCLFADCGTTAIKQPFFDDVTGLGTALSGVYSQILTRAPDADVYVLGYPQLLPTSGCSQTDGWMAWFNGQVEMAHAADGNPNATTPQIAALALVRAIGSAADLTTTQVNNLISAGAFEFSLTEVQTARDFVDALNIKIATTVGTANPRLHFVSATATGSPFLGHELCTSAPYFNGLDGVHQVYSYHPNAAGQAAYAELVKNNLS